MTPGMMRSEAQHLRSQALAMDEECRKLRAIATAMEAAAIILDGQSSILDFYTAPALPAPNVGHMNISEFKFKF